jgi:hypothetical protein
MGALAVVACSGSTTTSKPDASTAEGGADAGAGADAAQGDAASDGGGACSLRDSSSPCTSQSGFSCCDGACVNEANDPQNCGGCGTQCTAPKAMCVAGKCVVPTCSPACTGAEVCCAVNTAGPPPPPTCYAGPSCPLGCPFCQ